MTDPPNTPLFRGSACTALMRLPSKIFCYAEHDEILTAALADTGADELLRGILKTPITRSILSDLLLVVMDAWTRAPRGYGCSYCFQRPCRCKNSP